MAGGRRRCQVLVRQAGQSRAAPARWENRKKNHNKLQRHNRKLILCQCFNAPTSYFSLCLLTIHYTTTMATLSAEGSKSHRRRSSSIIAHLEPETIEEQNDQASLSNWNATWVNNKGMIVMFLYYIANNSSQNRCLDYSHCIDCIFKNILRFLARRHTGAELDPNKHNLCHRIIHHVPLRYRYSFRVQRRSLRFADNVGTNWRRRSVHTCQKVPVGGAYRLVLDIHSLHSLRPKYVYY